MKDSCQEDFIKNYVLCTNLEPEAIKSLEKISDDLDLNDAIIHIVRIIEIDIFSNEFVCNIYPKEEDYPEIKQYTFKKMGNLVESLQLKQNQVVTQCFFELNREEKIIDYLKEVNANLVVSVTRGKHGIDGFFSSSFTDFLCKFSPCDVLVMRQKKE